MRNLAKVSPILAQKFGKKQQLSSYENDKLHQSVTITGYLPIIQSLIYSYILPDFTLLFQSNESHWYIPEYKPLNVLASKPLL